MLINKAKFKEEVINFTNSNTYKYFKNAYFDIDEYLKDIEILKDEFDIQQILPKYDLNASDFYIWSVKTMIIAKFALNSAIDFIPENRVINEDYKLNNNSDKIEIIFGNLTVNGDFTNEGRLVVIGNVDIKGSWFDSYSETSIAGNLSVQNDLFTEGNLSVGGNLNAKLIYFSYNQGFATIVGDCNSKVLIERDHGGSWIFGEVNSDYLIFDELKMLNEKTENKNELIKNLSDLFKTEIVASLLENSSEMDENEIFEEFLNILYDTFSNKRSISI